jgi:hypothetical protein
VEAFMARSKKFVIVGTLVIIGYTLPWVIIGLLRWMIVGFDIEDIDNIQYLVSVFVCALAWFTSFHLWSRVSSLEGRIRKLFLISGFTFVVITIIFTYNTINILLGWLGVPSISGALNNAIPQVEFLVFNVEDWRITMPADSFVTFALILLAISFYLFPMERYVKQKLPWHTISMLVCTAIIPVILILRDIPDSMLILSIGTIAVVLWVFYNFLFLFYLYFSTGLKSPKGTAMRKASFMIGFGLLSIILTWIVGLIKLGEPILEFGLQMITGGVGITLFNYGFYLIRME